MYNVFLSDTYYKMSDINTDKMFSECSETQQFFKHNINWPYDIFLGFKE